MFGFGSDYYAIYYHPECCQSGIKLQPNPIYVLSNKKAKLCKGRRQKRGTFGWCQPAQSGLSPPPLPELWSITPDRDGAHKLCFIVFLHVLNALAWNKKW